MPRYNQNRMSLNTVGFTPTVFTPLEYKPVEQDYNILARSMAQQEERKEKATQQQSLVKQALGKAREQLHQDNETLAWFDDKANEIENKINDATLAGDYSGALIAGVTAASDLANDAELSARIKTNAQYKEEYERQRQRIGKGISQATFDWWVKNNPYTYENIESEGRVIGGKDWQSNFTPVDDVDAAQLALTAFKLLTPEKNTTNGTKNTTDKGVYTDLTKVDNSSYERISQQDILSNINNIIGTSPDNWRAVRQGFEVALNEVSNLKAQYENLDPNSDEYKLKKRQYEDQMSYFTGENGQILTNNESGWGIYYSRIIADNMFANGLAYNWKTTDTKRIAEDPNRTSTRGISDPDYQKPQRLEENTQSSKGNNVKVSQDTRTATSNAADAGNKAAQQFKQK